MLFTPKRAYLLCGVIVSSVDGMDASIFDRRLSIVDRVKVILLFFSASSFNELDNAPMGP